MEFMSSQTLFPTVIRANVLNSIPTVVVVNSHPFKLYSYLPVTCTFVYSIPWLLRSGIHVFSHSVTNCPQREFRFFSNSIIISHWWECLLISNLNSRCRWSKYAYFQILFWIAIVETSFKLYSMSLLYKNEIIAFWYTIILLF